MKSPSLKKAANGEGAKRPRNREASASAARASLLRGSKGAKAALRREFRAWQASLPTALERDTLLMPEVIAENVVREAERYLGTELPADYEARLAAKAHHLYPRHRHFHKMLNRPGDRGLHNLHVYMRHWVCGWLKRERSPLYRKLPWDYALGAPLGRRCKTP